MVALLAGLTGCNKPAPSEPSTTSPTPQTTSAQTQPVSTQPEEPVGNPQAVFWQGLQTLCGNAYRGQLTIGTEESDRSFGLSELTMKSRSCKKNAIDIGFKADDDDSRTWQFRRTADGLTLHHRHVDETGKPDATSGYGGAVKPGGTSVRQEFPADDNTGVMIPAAATNVWAVEIEPGKKFAYELQRIEEQRMFRVVFDLTEPL